ncbi:heme/hemin ABC transporter substrate-binding protein [Kiloniella spongiae]|uniref:heme/hemin ABC transporter substrate-binding protein n=1 Tax=Kiloniella spongiae TaxID=1489064 RepID=UPI0009E37E44|nr:ABC transporter substrate-binding protein [Kiloniella spongiae]
MDRDTPMSFNPAYLPRSYKTIVAFLICLLIAMSSTQTKADANRIITLGGPVTEIVYALEAGDKIVATDTTSKYPADVLALPKVGYMRQLSAEGLLSLKPDLILALEGSGPSHVLETIQAAGIKVVEIPELINTASIVTGIDLIAAQTNKQALGKSLSTTISTQLQKQYTEVKDLPEKPSVLFLLNTGHGGPMTAGGNTAIDTIITYAGAKNIAADLQSFKPLASEYILGNNPDYILMSKRSLDIGGGIKSLQKDPLLGKLSAVKNGRIVTLDGTLLFGLGPRTIDAVETLSSQINKQKL